jgi:cytidylate kinase
MTIIAMTREMGSLGKDVAEGLARELGLRLMYHEVIDGVSEKMHLSQNVITRFLQGKEGLLEGLRVDREALSLYTAEEVLDTALHGNLMIRGWGATCLLRPVSHVVCVRVCAPLELRTRRIMERIGIDDPELA